MTLSNQTSMFPQQQNAPTFSTLARSGRSFGNDLTARGNNKRPNDAIANGPVKSYQPGCFEKRVSKKADAQGQIFATAASTTIVTTANRNGNHGRMAVTATAPDSLANLPISTKGGLLPIDTTGTVFPFNVAPPTLAEPKQQPEQTDARSDYQYTGKADDIDKDDHDDPLMATDYVEDIYALHRERELLTSVKPTYMKYQPHINERMRAILIDWLVEVHLKYELVEETLYLAVSLLDRYLKKAVIAKENLQLMGLACLWIASKYEDIYPPEILQLVAVCDQLYTKREILDMETTVLQTLQYQVTVSHPYDFLVRYLKAAHADEEMADLSCYLLEGAMLSYHLLEYLPSQIASAAVLITRKVCGLHNWSPTLLKVTEYREEDILPVARALLEAKMTTESSDHWLKLRVIRRKYASPRFSLSSTKALPAPGDL